MFWGGSGAKHARCLLVLLLCLSLLTSGCTAFRHAREKVENVMTTTDVTIIKYHVEGYVHL